MNIIDFRDTCVITRDNGERDEWDNPLDPTQVYSGPCLYQEGGSGYAMDIIMKSSPTVYLPGNNAMVMINDTVSVTTERGRGIKATAEIVRDINLPWQANIKCTRIELKQAKGD